MRLIIGAFFLEGACLAFWLSSDTMISPKEYKWMMENPFFFYREYSLYGSICLIWDLRLDYTETIHDSMYMGVDSDIRHIIEYGEYDFCCFYTDTRKCLNETQVIWEDAMVALCEYSSSFFYEARFITEEVYTGRASMSPRASRCASSSPTPRPWP